MGEVLGIGLSHYPGFIYADAEMAMRVKSTITSPKVPMALKVFMVFMELKETMANLVFTGLKV